MLLRFAVCVLGFLGSAVIGEARAEETPRIEKVLQLGHSQAVASVAFSPDGKTALSGSFDHTARLWDLATGREIRKLEGHSKEVTSVAFSPDGKTALSGSADCTVRLWDLATGREIRKLEGHSGVVLSVAFSPDSTTALSGSFDHTARLWDLATGREIRKIEGHSGRVSSVAFSPDGKTALSGSEDKTVRLWDLVTGREIRKLEGHSSEVYSVAFSPDVKTALSGSEDNTVRLWDLATGREIRMLVGHSGWVSSVAFSPDGKTALSGSEDKMVRLWDLATGREIRTLVGHSGRVTSVAFSPDGKTALSGSFDHTARLWDLATGREIRKFEGHTHWVDSVAFSPDGKTALSGSGALSASVDNTVRLWDLATGREIRKLEGHSGWVEAVAYSPDGKTALSASFDHTARLWDLATGREILTLEGHSELVTSVAFSPDGKTALSGSDDRTVRLWDLATGREIRKLEGHSSEVYSVAFSPDGKTALSGSEDFTARLWDLATGREIRTLVGHSGRVSSVAFSPDGKTALSGSWDKTVRLWDLATGREIRKLEGHSGGVISVAFSPDGKTALSGSADGTMRLWNIQSGEELAALIASPDGEYMTFTPSGFFATSQRDTDMLAIARGMEVTTIAQVHQSLFNPDLVREALAGDPDGEVKRAAEVINLEKVLDSGPAPQVEIVSPPSGSKSDTDLATVAARITDRGKGIGRIEWRLNGVTASVMTAPAGPGPDYDVKQELALDPGENRVEVIAYEGRNLLASLPARTTIAYDGPADSVKPKLFVLAIGINAYEDNGWAPPGADHVEYFAPLDLAVGDAQTFAAEMQKAGAGLYGDGNVRVRTALDAEATAAGLDRIVQEMSGEIGPRDTFVFFAAGHGYSLDGRFYLIPQDYNGGTSPKALARRAIGQERLQDWIANRIKAKKAIILLDTCESGALTQGYTRSRVDRPASEAAIGRLHEATGRPVLTAAAEGQDAKEAGKLGHGVFTYALLNALRHADSNNNGLIEVSELAAYVEDLVPKLIPGGTGRSAVTSRGAGDEGRAQFAHFGSTGEDFAVVARLP